MIIEYLESKNISYRTSGNNVGRNWIGIDCPYCYDNSNHMGIHLYRLATSCFKCGNKQSFEKLIYDITREPWGRIKEEVEKIKNFLKLTPLKEKIKYNSEIIEKFITDSLDDVSRKYLISRNFSVEQIIKKFKVCTARPSSGKLAHRILIPYFHQGQMVALSGRDFTGADRPKYYHLPDTPLSPKEILYNIDTVKDTAIVVEGALDAWRVGDGCVALSGKKASMNQINQLSTIKKVFIMLDRDARKEAVQLGKTLSDLNVYVEMLDFDSKDPAEINQDEINNLRKEVFGS